MKKDKIRMNGLTGIKIHIDAIERTGIKVKIHPYNEFIEFHFSRFEKMVIEILPFKTKKDMEQIEAFLIGVIFARNYLTN